MRIRDMHDHTDSLTTSLFLSSPSSLDRGKSGYEIRRVLRRKPKAKVAMLRLFREEHKYSLAFEKSFRLHCRESPIEAYLKERRRRTRRARNIRFRSFFRNLFDFEDSNASSTTP